VGVAGGHGRVSENTIAYFAQKVYWKVICFQEKEKNLPKNVGVNGENFKLFGETMIF